MSNESVVTARTTSAPVIPGSSRTLVRRLTTLRCGTSTPLGTPVDPDV